MSSIWSPGVPAPTVRPPPVPAIPLKSNVSHDQNGVHNGYLNHSVNPNRIELIVNTPSSRMDDINGNSPTMNGFAGGTQGSPLINGGSATSLTNSRHNLSVSNGEAARLLDHKSENRPLNPTEKCRARIRTFLNSPRDKHFCTLCRQGFATSEDEMVHKKSNGHNLQFMKVNYAQQRNTLQKDKCLVTVKADPERLETNGTTTVSGNLLIHLDASSSYCVRILSCDPFIRPEGVEIRHPAFDERQAIKISPGQTIAIAVYYTTCIPIEINVPIGLKFCLDGKSSPFHIIREMTFFCSCDDLTPEETMGDHDCEVEFHKCSFKEVERLYAPPKVRTNNVPELPMPKFDDSYEIPEKLLSIQNHLNSIRIRDESPVMDKFTIDCFAEITKLIEMPVNERNYIMKFQMMLYLEEMAKRAQLMSQNLASIKIICTESGGYQVYLPGLPERRPPISVGFRVNVRESVDSTIVYQGVFTSIEESTARFRMDSIFDRIFLPTNKYSLEFQFSRRLFQIMHNSLRGVENEVFAGEHSCLFPRSDLLNKYPRIPLMTENEISGIAFFDPKVRDNPEQFQAVKSILKGTHRPAPFILFGPPGTGKTSTIAEAIKQIVSHQRSSRILVCASSNSACDVICDKILKHIDHRLIYRVYSASFETSKISARIKEHGCHNYVNGAVDFPGEDTLRQNRIIVATLSTAWRFEQLSKDFFTHVFIDECGFAMEPEALVPVFTALGDWTDRCERKPGRHLILAGDIQQLGPVLASSMVGSYLSISLMERLMKDVHAPYQKPFNSMFIVKLLRNYRSHRHILEIPNRLFYDGELQEHADENSSCKFINWKHLVNKQVPLIFHNCVSEERRDPHSTSYFNLQEAETVLHYVNAVLKENKVGETEIGVITPYAAQARRIRNLFHRRGLYDVKIGSVEEFQGQERMVIIVSTVRNCKDLMQRDLLQRLGFLKNPKRFNVALTRAKALLICIGNASILKRDVCWAEFIDYVEKQKAWSGVPPENAVVINRLKVLEAS